MSKGLSKEDTKQEHPLQAVVLCDAWGEEARWGPLVRRNKTDEEEFEGTEVGGEQRPWCLLPLINTPLLAWTLECLSSGNVEQVFLFVRDGVEEVRAWLSASTFMSATSSLSIIVRPTTAVTPGDVLRELDSLQILAPADFLVVQAGYVGNIDLSQRVKSFGEKRKEDPTLAMCAMVAPKRSTTTSTFAVHVLSSENRLLHYEQSNLYPKLKSLALPREIVERGSELTVRADLEAIGVAICSIEVPPLFTENFDYQFFYPDFVNGILTSDLLNATISCIVVGEEPYTGSRRSAPWAGVVGNTKSYDAISRSILSRRVYPLAPDENMPNSVDRYLQRSGRVYLGKDLDFSRTSAILSTSLVGDSTVIGENSTVDQSVISSSVRIGGSCTISSSYIFSGAVIGDNCHIENSIIGERAIIGPASTIDGGALIGSNAELGSGASIHGSRVSVEQVEGDATSVDGHFGLGANSFFWPSESCETAQRKEVDDEDWLDPRNREISKLGSRFESLSISYPVSPSSSSLSTLSRSSSSSNLSSTSSTENHSETSGIIPGIAQLAETESDFVSECTQSLERSFQEGHTVDNAAIELKTLRMASNVQLNQVREVVIPFILDRIKGGPAGVGPLLKRWGGLITNLTGDQEAAMEHCLLTTQIYVAEKANADVKLFQYILKSLYEEDVVTDEAVFAWYKSPEARSVGGENGKGLWAGAKPFVEALMEDSDDDEEGEDD